MLDKQRIRAPTMYGPAIYQIRVRGRLADSWSDRIGGMQITETRGTDVETETILVTPLRINTTQKPVKVVPAAM